MNIFNKVLFLKLGKKANKQNNWTIHLIIEIELRQDPDFNRSNQLDEMLSSIQLRSQMKARGFLNKVPISNGRFDIFLCVCIDFFVVKESMARIPPDDAASMNRPANVANWIKCRRPVDFF